MRGKDEIMRLLALAAAEAAFDSFSLTPAEQARAETEIQRVRDFFEKLYARPRPGGARKETA